MRCLDCHYSLKNLTEHRCPECGRAFDPHDPKTFVTSDIRRIHRALKRTVWIALGASLVFGTSIYFDVLRLPAAFAGLGSLSVLVLALIAEMVLAIRSPHRFKN